MTESVSAVIVTYNSVETISQCVASLRHNGVTTIIVVDNASTDTTIQTVRSLEVTLLANTTNQGFAAACNQGWEQVITPYVLFLNPDAELQSDTLSKAVNVLEQDKYIGVVGLQLITPDGQPEPYSWGQPVTPWSFWTRRWQSANASTNLTKCGWVSGGGMLARRQALLAVNGFDPHFFMYWEDVDLGRRLWSAGWSVTHLASAHVIHQRGGSGNNQVTKTRIYDQSADRYWRKHYATPIWLGMRLARLVYRWWSPWVA